MSNRSWPNSTETMAERAWRYGLNAEPGEFIPGWLYCLTIYADNSTLLHFSDESPAEILFRWDEASGGCQSPVSEPPDSGNSGLTPAARPDPDWSAA